MTAPPALTLYLADAEATERLGQTVAPLLRAGDVLLLHGAIGAGKTHFARAVIQARLAATGRFEHVPSPTYTLVQTYDAGGAEIWHADLFRLGDADEIAELGLEQAFDTAICLVEWPGLLGARAPQKALHMHFAPRGEGREVTLRAAAARWAPLLAALARKGQDA
jgi:tRNA threonylcarbamoyladenosine biosynthesis protein TsaE